MATATVVPGSIVLEVLNQDNYEQWSFRVKTYLLAKDLWDFVKAPTQQFGDGVGDKVWTKKNAEALYAIQISCGTDIFTFIKDINDAKHAWDTLEKKFCSEVKILDTPGSENKDQPEIANFEYFLTDVKSGDWGKAKEFIAKHPDAVRARSALNGTTALHVAISAGHLHIVKELLPLMTEEDLEITDGYGVSTFGCAVQTGTIQMVRCLVDKNKQIVSKRLTSPRDMNMTPVLVAYKAGNWKMARYLYSVTPVEFLIQENEGYCDGAELISPCFLTHEFDIALDLIQRYPILAITRDYSGYYPFNALASVRSVFPSRERLKFWQRWIYDSIYKHYPTPTISDICCVNIFEKPEDDEGNQTEHIPSVIRGFFQAPVANLLQLLGFKCIYDMKLVHIHTQFLQRMCEEVKNKQLVQVPFLRKAIFQAVEGGHVEFIDLLRETNPDLLRVTDGKGRNILQHAIESRQAKVYDSIYKHDKERNATINSKDTCNNGTLHAAGNLYPHLDHIQGAPLQMQRELQWFEEVKNIAPANVRELTNCTDDMTAQELFSKNHKELVKEGEKSLKDTATSCTVAGALIVTMMFAASFTVPGGIRGDTGFPMFLKKPLFTVFIISDSISLSASTTSVMIFLGILTSRYKEKDFLKSLPTKLILGLFALFLSIATMMIAFCCALVITLHRESWIFIPIISLASVLPIFTFGLMQAPLLCELFVSTYVRRMFEKKT